MSSMINGTANGTAKTGTTYSITNGHVSHEHNGKGIRQDLDHAFASIAGLVKASLRPLPNDTDDGTYVEKRVHASVLKTLSTLRFRDVLTLKDIVEDKVSGEPTDDKTYLMERVVQLAAELPIDSRSGVSLTNNFINMLWADLEHPPLSYLDERYKYRQADGSYNNIRWPQLGAAGTPYARTVRPQTPQAYALPDPGVLFDGLMARKSFTPHPTKISSVLFYLASIIIHDAFRTSHADFGISMTSSYLDLSPLYGSNQAEQNLMREFRDGRLKPDCFSETRILGFPPGVGVLLIMFNRFHNYIVSQLPVINEGGRFTKPTDGDEKALAKYDNDLFQTGRLITCGLYINCILKDYVRVILNLHRTDSVWDLDPRTQEGKTLFGAGAAEGVGNQVSAEFNLVYRWHAAVSERDEKWTDEAMKDILGGQDPSQVSFHELVGALETWARRLPEDPHARPFTKLQRQADGTFDDDALVSIMADSVEDVAGAFGANHVPQALRAVEILGIMQSRKWNLATLNEFRAHFNLKPHATFEEINPDPHVAGQLRHLYDHPDLVELYPGLAVEAAKAPLAPGSGLCPSYTVSRAVLSDAVALVRGDRFYTVDYTPRHLTHWGFQEASADVAVDQGHVFYKLFLRAFPRHFRPDSVYAHFPLVVPDENRKIHEDLGIAHRYSYERPAYTPPPTIISSYDAAAAILNDQENYHVTWGPAIEFLMHRGGQPYGRDFMLSGDRPANAHSKQAMHNALYKDQWHAEVRAFYEATTLDLLRTHTTPIAGVPTVDVVGNVGNLAQVRFAAAVFALPLKTEQHPHGVYTERELYLVMALVFTCVFYDLDPPKSFPLRQAARQATQRLGELVEALVEPYGVTGVLRDVLERFHTEESKLSAYGAHMIERLLESGYGVKELVWSHILPTAGGMVAIQVRTRTSCDPVRLDERKLTTTAGPALRAGPRLLPRRRRRAPPRTAPPGAPRHARGRRAHLQIVPLPRFPSPPSTPLTPFPSASSKAPASAAPSARPATSRLHKPCATATARWSSTPASASSSTSSPPRATPRPFPSRKPCGWTGRWTSMSRGASARTSAWAWRRAGWGSRRC